MHSLHELITSVHNWKARVCAGFLSRRDVILQEMLKIFRYNEKL
jgi:hypothetical protein